MVIKKIYFDMDGVLADFKRGINEICGMEMPVQGQCTDEEDSRMWEAVKEAGHFYDMLEPMEGALNMYKELSSKYECAILSAPPKAKRGIVTAAEDKTSWVRRLLSDTMEINIVPKEEKRLKAAGKEYILIDDLERNINEWEECGGTGILFESAQQVLDRIREIERG